MARLARVIVPGYRRRVTQRGNRRRRSFFLNGDYGVSLTLMAEWCAHCGVEVWAYCLMPNHTHLICVPLAGARETGAKTSRRRAEISAVSRQFRIGNLVQMKKKRNRKGGGNEP